MRRIILFVIALAALATPAFAWSFTGDPEGARLDSEARRVLTTQNVCGVVIDAAYLKSLYARIARHFDPALNYPLYLRRSVLSANSAYLADAEPAAIALDCRPRIEDLRRQHVLVE